MCGRRPACGATRQEYHSWEPATRGYGRRPSSYWFLETTHDRLGGDQEARQGRDGSIPMDLWDQKVPLNRQAKLFYNWAQLHVWWISIHSWGFKMNPFQQVRIVLQGSLDKHESAEIAGKHNIGCLKRFKIWFVHNTAYISYLPFGCHFSWIFLLALWAFSWYNASGWAHMTSMAPGILGRRCFGWALQTRRGMPKASTWPCY